MGIKVDTLLFFILITVCKFSVSCAVNITLTVQPETLILREGYPFTLSCDASFEGGRANVSLHYSWEKDGELIVNGSRQVMVLSATASDGGVYVCVAEAGGVEITSINITVTVTEDDPDNVPLIALIVCATVVGVFLTVLLSITGLYMCIKRDQSDSLSKLSSCESGSKHDQHRVPARLSPSVPRHFANRDRSKSKSLSHLLQAHFPLESNLHRSSTNQLAGSQPTQVTEIEDPNTLDDLVLDEGMFEQGTPSERSESRNKRAANNMGGHRESRRRASEGTLTDSLGTSVKSILKSSKSVSDNLNDSMNRSCGMSNASSEVTHSDENSLHLGKSVRFNVSTEDCWAEDSGVQTGASTPHNTTHSSLKRRASAPDTMGYHSSNTERRGSAPGDLVCVTDIDTAQIDDSEREEDHSGEIDEGLATGSEEWGQRESFDFEKEKVEKRFEGIFFSEAHTQAQSVPSYASANNTTEGGTIANRVAQLLSAAHHNEPRPGSFVRGPSSLATTYHSATISVADMKRKLLQRKEQEERATGTTAKEDGKHSKPSKLVQERKEAFQALSEKNRDLRTASLDRAHLKRGRHLNLATFELALRKHRMEEVVTHKKATVEKDGPSKPTNQVTTVKEAQVEEMATPDKLAPTSTPVWSSPTTIPVFAHHSNLSNWVPACLREANISPYYSYEDDDQTNQYNEAEGDSDKSSDEEEMMMEPLQPTTGASVGPIFGGVATITPIGRSWLSSPNKPLGAPLTKPIMTGARENSPFNESIPLQRSGHRVGVHRLSVIPEETPSACNSMTNVAAHTF